MSTFNSVSSTIQEVEEKIWSAFNIIRGELSGDGFHIVLFLLTLKKIGFRSKFLINSNKNHVVIHNFLQLYDEENDSNFLEIYGLYDYIVCRLSEEKFIQFYSVIDSIDSSLLKNNFIAIFDSILYGLLQSLGKFSGAYLLPFELSRFMSSLVSLPNNAKIYNPFSGVATFGVLTNDQNEYLGQEIGQTTWLIGKLRLLACDSLNNKTIVRGDSIGDWNPFHLKYDLIISSPPFNMQLVDGISGKFGSIRKVDQFLIEQSLLDLKEDGKLVVLVAENFLWSNGPNQKLRENLINEDLLESVISFPAGILQHASIKTSVLVINKAKKTRGIVNFIDAADFVSKQNAKTQILDDKALIALIENDIETNSYKKISNSIIKNADSFLDAQRYFIEDFEGFKLQDFATPIRGTNAAKNQIVKWVRIKDLKDDNLNFHLQIDEVDEVELTKSANKIDESCILVSKVGSSLKPTFFQFFGTPIVISHEILALRLDEKFAMSIYVTNELYEDYVVKQIEAFRKGVSVPKLNTSDILNIKLSIPSIEEQRGQVEKYLELSAKLTDLELQKESLKKGFNKLQFDEFASLKHSLGTPRQNLLSNSKTLIRFFEKEDSEEFKNIDLKFRERYDVSLLEVFNQVKNDINQISIILEKGENGLIVSNYEKELVPIQNINTFITELSTNSFNFKIDRKLLQIDDCSNKNIEINIILLKILFDNILTNAHKYGFDAIEETNTVMIELAIVENQLEIAIKNNGKPFPNNFDKEKFISKFSSTNNQKGTGIGGYDINRIATYFGNDDWALELNSNPIYPVIFKFLFPIKNAINEQ